MPNANKPVQHIRRGSVQAAIWKNAAKTGPFYTTSLERRYRDKSGEWKTTHAFGRDELLVLAKVADLAHSAIHDLQQADRAAAASSGQRGARPDADSAGPRSTQAGASSGERRARTR
ncbi:MAG: hypothetical protein ACKVS8_08880 [Phycisphaerales bacterium]